MASIPAPGEELLRAVRAGFVRKGTSLGTWCKEHGWHLSNARQALMGSWNGPSGRRLRAQLIKAAGLQVAA